MALIEVTYDPRDDESVEAKAVKAFAIMPMMCYCLIHEVPEEDGRTTILLEAYEDDLETVVYELNDLPDASSALYLRDFESDEADILRLFPIFMNGDELIDE